MTTINAALKLLSFITVQTGDRVQRWEKHFSSHDVDDGQMILGGIVHPKCPSCRSNTKEDIMRCLNDRRFISIVSLRLTVKWITFWVVCGWSHLWWLWMCFSVRNETDPISGSTQTPNSREFSWWLIVSMRQIKERFSEIYCFFCFLILFYNFYGSGWIILLIEFIW